MRLVGRKVKVLVTASVVETDGELSIRSTHYTTSELLSPEQVTLKHPNPTRDNGLLLVIEGEHCGKYVRRIHH
jgi:hypothetical protein